MNQPKKIQGQPAIAALLSAHFGASTGVTLGRQQIQRWRMNRYLPAGMEPFPAPDHGNRYDVKACLDWMRRFIEARKRNPELLRCDENKNEARARRERAMANREERNDQREAQATMERATMKADLLGIIQRLKPADMREEVKSFCYDALRDLGIGEEVIHGFALKLSARMADITARRDAMFSQCEAQISAGDWTRPAGTTWHPAFCSAATSAS